MTELSPAATPQGKAKSKSSAGTASPAGGATVILPHPLSLR